MTKRLRLRREAVRLLTPADLARLAGGATATCAGCTSYGQPCVTSPCYTRNHPCPSASPSIIVVGSVSTSD